MTPTGDVTLIAAVTEGEILNANNLLADEDGLGTLSYQWSRDGSPIDGATASTYTLVQDDVGAVIAVTVSYTDDEGHCRECDLYCYVASDECQSFTNWWCNNHRCRS